MFCKQFDKCSKFGIQEDRSGGEQISLKQYVDRMTDGLNDNLFLRFVSSSPFGAYEGN